MSKLINLRHLCLPYHDPCGLFSRIDGLGSLTCLRELDVSGRKVGELGGMGMLRKLRIRNLEEVETEEVASQARLDSKEHLQELSLYWGEEETNREVEEEVLQALRPVHSIEELIIDGYKGAKSPTWMEDPTAWRSFCLQDVRLWNCPNWVVLPAFGQLRLLRILYISNMPSVRRLDLRFFPSLEILYIEDMPEWEEWGSGHPDPPPQQNPSSSSPTSPSSSFFPRLRYLEIRKCPKLRELPPLPPTLEDLHVADLPSVRRLGLRLFPSLEDLSIDNLAEWEEWGSGHPDPPPQQNPSSSSSSATSLSSSIFTRHRQLTIMRCPKLRELPPLPPTLEYLHIDDLPEWEEWGSGHPDPPPQQNPFSSSSATSPSSSIFPPLRQLTISGCPKLSELPPLPPTLRGLFLKAGECSNLMMSVPGLLGHHLTALESLQIYDCEEPLSLPEGGFGHLVSLKTLEIKGCSKLTCPALAEGAPSQHLPLSLKKLEIADCGDAMGGWWWAGLQHLTSLAELSLRGCPTTVDSLFVSLTRHHRHHLAETLTETKIERCGYDYRQQSTPPPPLPSNPLQDATAEEFRPLTSLLGLNMSKSPNLPRKWAGAGLLSSLRRLLIQDDDDLDDGWLSTCLQYLTSLEDLSLSHCPAITSLPAGAALQSLRVADCEELASLGHFPALPSLKKLYITSCPKLNSLLQSPSSSSSSSSSSIEEFNISNSSPQQINGWLLQSNLAFPFLRKLEISKCPQLTSFGEDAGGKELEASLLHLAPSLRWLTFQCCENLSSLPAQLSSLCSLETLRIIDCPKIQSLPEMGLPASLQSLYILGCPTLEERCRDQGGPERCNISRVPQVYIDRKRIV